MTLVIYGIKCGLSKDEIKKDAIDLIPFLNGLNKEEPFTEEDIKSALECYDERYNTFPLKDIEKLTNIRIERNKRNGRKQDQHLKIARFTRDLNYDDPNGWINKEGAPTKQSIVQKWRLEHPEGKKADCIRDTGLTKPTVYKWWDENKKVKKSNQNEIPRGHFIPQNIIKTRSDSDTVNVMIQLPKSTLEKINNMSLNELETVMEVQEDENVIGYAYYRMMWLKNNEK